MHSYLYGRKQRVKSGYSIIKWQNIMKGVPQGSYCHKIYEIVISTLQLENTTMIEWFSYDQMLANPGKFQAIAAGQKSAPVIKSLSIVETDVKSEAQFKLLGIEIDHLLKFEAQISIIYKIKYCSTIKCIVNT